MALHNHRLSDRADMGGGPDGNERWGSGMTDWREELIEKMAKAAWEGPGNFFEWKRLDKITQETYLEEAHAALAVAEPVIREQCAEDAAAIAKEHLTDAVARIVATAIREGGKDE